MTFYYPLDHKQDTIVRAKVVERIVERSEENFRGWMDDMPGRAPVSGREELAFYRAQPEAWLTNLAASYPDEARRVIRRWSMLLTRYGAAPSPAPEPYGEVA